MMDILIMVYQFVINVQINVKLVLIIIHIVYLVILNKLDIGMV